VILCTPGKRTNSSTTAINSSILPAF